jgi:hypothetical protein
MPFATTLILPTSAISLRRILQPIHPARRAVGASGGRFSIAAGVKKKDGIPVRRVLHHKQVWNSVAF